ELRTRGCELTMLGRPNYPVDRGRLPWWVPYFNRVAKPLLALGVPMGPDLLITVQGRKTGLPRTTPVTICEYGGRRGLISPFGETILDDVRSAQDADAMRCLAIRGNPRNVDIVGKRHL